MNTIKQSIAINAIADAIADKSLRVGVKVFINDCKVASTDDLCVLLDRVRKGKERLTAIYTDDLNRRHFVTAW